MTIVFEFIFNMFKTRLLRVFVETSFYKNILKHVIPYIRFSLYYTSMRGWKYHRGYKLLKPGHIIVTRDSKKLTTTIIGGDWSHAALCISKNESFEIAEMTHDDYTLSTFADLCFQADRVAIYECIDWPESYINNVIIPTCLDFKDQHYDAAFKLNNKFLYCSELIYEADKQRRLRVNLEDLAGLGNKYISPTGLVNSPNAKLIWDSNNEEYNQASEIIKLSKDLGYI